MVEFGEIFLSSTEKRIDERRRQNALVNRRDGIRRGLLRNGRREVERQSAARRRLRRSDAEETRVRVRRVESERRGRGRGRLTSESAEDRR